MSLRTINDLEVYREAMSLGESVWSFVTQGHLRQPHSVKMTANFLSSALARNLMNSFNRLSVSLDLRKFSAIFYTKAGCRRCPQWDVLAKDTVGKQLIRSSDSIAANISEGYGRYHFKENQKFCFYARGSLEETQTWIEKSVKRKLIPENQGRQLYRQLQTLKKRLNAYIRSIGTDHNPDD